jgi:hypothetical protein
MKNAENISKISVGKVRKNWCAEKFGKKQMGQPCLNNVTYKPYIQPILQYGNEAKIITIPATFNKLEVIQNQVLRLIAGAVTSTPLTTMQVLTTNKRLKTEKKLP